MSRQDTLSSEPGRGPESSADKEGRLDQLTGHTPQERDEDGSPEAEEERERLLKEMPGHTPQGRTDHA